VKEDCDNLIVGFETVNKQESDQLTTLGWKFARFVLILDPYHLN